MASASTPTVIDLKTSFLRTQILSLSAPLRPSSSRPVTEEENAIRQKSIDDVLLKLNKLLKEHNRRAYGPQALRHVAEQVDRLYWNAGERGPGAVGGLEEEWAERGSDLRQEHIISQLPEQWSEEAEAIAPEKAQQYVELQSRLAELNERRKAAREKVERYKTIKQLLVPFEDAGEIVQGNLVTKGGEVEKELEKMKLLVVRVMRGMGGLEDKRRDAEDMDIDGEDEGERKVLALLGGGQ